MSLFGIYYFSGVGPSIPVRVRTSGSLDTEVKSEFIAKGINQTLHRVYVNFECYVKIITPMKSFQKKILLMAVLEFGIFKLTKRV